MFHSPWLKPINFGLIRMIISYILRCQQEVSKMYTFKTKPYDHQLDAFNKSWKSPYHALFMEMGTGKTKVIVDTMGALFENSKITHALVLAPKGVFDNWVQLEIPAHLPERIKRYVVRWQPNFTQKYKEELLKVAVPDRRDENTLNILVMNIEALSTKKGAGAAYRFLELNPNSFMAVDESTTIKNRTAARTKNVLRCGEMAKYRRILTGSPVTKSPMDLYTQCGFLSLDALNFRSYFSFQARYAVMRRRTMGVKNFQEIVSFQRLDELSEKLNAFATRVLKEDCLDLPAKVYVRRKVELTSEQRKLYGQMKELALAQLADGKLATTANVLTQIMRLHQIACGHFQPDEDAPIEPLNNNRLNELLSICEENSGKSIIWATWTHDIKAIEEALTNAYGPDSVASYYGATPQDERQEIVRQFEDVNSPLRFFVGQPSTAGYGITLIAASTVIYYSNSYNLEHRIQSEDRAHRIGQKKSVTYIDLYTPGTIDEKITQALRDKINLAGKVLGEDLVEWLV
tara:strand:- start:217 stop:1764 length:1548 start_codon:yes stop_codon:yes gene_type:complete